MKHTKTFFQVLVLVFSLSSFFSCQEAGEVDEYDNWKARCEAYIDSIARVAASNSDGKWKTFRSFTLVGKDVDGKDADWGTENYVYCHVEQTGSGTTLPFFTDTVCVNYRGRLMPTSAHPEGYIFDQSFKGEVNPQYNIPTKFGVGALTIGVSTAIQQMHVGDVWRIYIPATLGYGKSDQKNSSGIPAYSALIFDMNLVEIIKP